MTSALVLLSSASLAAIAASSGANWLYKDAKSWHEVHCTALNECASVGTQSPINVPTGELVGNEALQHIDPSSNLMWSHDFMETCRADFTQVINQHTWQVNFPKSLAAGSMCNRDIQPDTGDSDYPHVKWGGHNYYLNQFHYHSPSEHTVDGKFYDMEVHHVHVNKAGQALVVGVFVNAGHADNSFMSAFWDNFPTDLHHPSNKPPAEGAAGGHHRRLTNATEWDGASPRSLSGHGHGPVKLDYVPYTNFFPQQDYSYWHYMGSFTTPPCTTNTIWILFPMARDMSVKQVKQYREALSNLPNPQKKDADGKYPAPAADNSYTNQLLFDEDLVYPGVNLQLSSKLGANNRPVKALGTRKVYFHKADIAGYVLPLLIVLAVLSWLTCCGLLAYAFKKGEEEHESKGSETGSDDEGEEEGFGRT